MAARSDITTFAEWLSFTQAGVASVEAHIDDILQDCATRTDWLTEATLVSLVAGTGEYSLPAAVVNVLSAFYDDRELWPDDGYKAVELDDPHWRTRTGVPYVYFVDDTVTTKITMYKAPTTTTTEFYLPGFSPFPPAGFLTLIHTQPGPELPPWAPVILGLRALSQEFARDSDRKDLNFVTATKQLADFLEAAYG